MRSTPTRRSPQVDPVRHAPGRIRCEAFREEVRRLNRLVQRWTPGSGALLYGWRDAFDEPGRWGLVIGLCAGGAVLGRRSVPTDLVRNIELLVGVALPLFLTGVFLQDHLTGSGHWAHPLESAFFEWLSLVPVLVFVGLLHSVAVAVIASVWPRAANRLTVLVGAVLLVALL